jgi:hypothetical protein
MNQHRVATLRLELDLDADPIGGIVHRTGGRERSFSGWIELVRTIETELEEGRRAAAARTGQPTPATRDQTISEGTRS